MGRSNLHFSPVRRNETVSLHIVGSKGIPAKYGGFETFVEKLAEYQKDSNFTSNTIFSV